MPLDSKLQHKRARLTKGNLKVFERMTRGKRSNNPSSSKPTSVTETKSSQSKQTTSTTESTFWNIAEHNGILDRRRAKPPANLQYHQEQLDRSRGTASPTLAEYEDFKDAMDAPNEDTLKREMSVLFKRYYEPGYRMIDNKAFTAFPQHVGLNNGLSAAQPDMIEGLLAERFAPFPVGEELGGAATVYLGENRGATLPHLAGEFKAPGKDMIVASHQAAYDGACMVYCRGKARSYLEDPDPADHAYVSSFTTDGEHLYTYVHYAKEDNGTVKYHQYETSESRLVQTYEGFKQSRRRMRNLQDYAKETSQKLRDELNEKWASRPPVGLDIPPEADLHVGSTYDTTGNADGEEPNASAEYTSMQAPTTSGHAPKRASRMPKTRGAPSRSLKHVSIPADHSEDVDAFNGSDHRRTSTRRTRLVEEVKEADSVEDLPPTRKSHRKRRV